MVNNILFILWLDGWNICRNFEKSVNWFNLNYLLEDSETLYCICQKKYKEGDPMMGMIYCYLEIGFIDIYFDNTSLWTMQWVVSYRLCRLHWDYVIGWINRIYLQVLW